MTSRLSYGAALLAVWVALWADVTVANIVSGLVVVVVLLTAFPLRGKARLAFPRPLATLRFAGYFFWKLCEASVVVAWEVVTPRNRVREGIVAVPVRGVSDVVTTIVANTISLVPGTLTLEVSPDRKVLYVHVLHLRDVEAVRQEIAELEAIVIRAFGPKEALDARTEKLAASASVRPSEPTAAASGRGEPKNDDPKKEDRR